jgi:hypothetical protein
MIAIGQVSEEADPLGIICHVADALYLTKAEKKFNFVVAFYLINYDKTIDELDRMVQIIGDQLKYSSKGYFLSNNWNVCLVERIINSDMHRKHGYRCEAETPLSDAAQIKNTHFNPDGSSFPYITYYFSESWLQALQMGNHKSCTCHRAVRRMS